MFKKIYKNKKQNRKYKDTYQNIYSSQNKKNKRQILNIKQEKGLKIDKTGDGLENE